MGFPGGGITMCAKQEGAAFGIWFRLRRCAIAQNDFQVAQDTEDKAEIDLETTEETSPVAR
jgi:hypothetical protein